MATLTYENGALSGRRHELTKDKYILGRHPDCDIVVDVGAVSRHHAQLTRDDNGYHVEDLNSRNGTFVNDRPVYGRQLLAEGDRIRVCDIFFSFQSAPTETGVIENSTINSLWSGGSQHGAVLVDDQDEESSTIMSKLNVSSSEDGSVHVSASADVKLKALLEITRNVSRSLSLDDVLDRILASLFQIFIQADRGLIILRNQDGRLEPRWTKLRRPNADDTIRISRTIVNSVIEAKQAILTADAMEDSRFEMSESIADFRIRSMMCAPLIDIEGNAFGVLQIDTQDQRKRYREEDLEVLLSVASQAAVAIVNAQMHENALKQKELERELTIAHEVQNGFLPDRRPSESGYKFFHYYRPANHVGGDYFDYIRLSNGNLAVIVADVSGHGIAAALLMVKLSAIARVCLASEATPAAAITRLNQEMSESDIEGRFVTLVMTVLEPANSKVTIVNAGHMEPMIRRADGSIVQPGESEKGLPLTVAPDIEYESLEVSLNDGDVVLLYTDGLPEATNKQEELFTIERIVDRMKSSSGATEAGEQIMDDIGTFLDGLPPSDDMCLVCFSKD